MLRMFELEGEPSLARLALIVRGADTARYDIAEAAGLHAVSLGLSASLATTTMACLKRALSSTMRCSPGCALLPRSGTTGRPRRRDEHGTPGGRLRGPSFAEAFMVWLKIGCINFGGPAGQIALMHRIVVDERNGGRRGAFSARAQFLHAAAGPGGNAARDLSGLADAWRRGGLAAGILFVLPGAFVMLA